MRNLKKALSLALALVMLLGVMVVGAGAAKFSDVPRGSDNEAAVEVMNAIDIIKGDGNGEFRPDDTLTRAEAAVIISKVLMTPSIVAKIAENTVTSKFADVNAYEDGWAAPYVEACVASQVILGDDDGNFAPAREVSGAEFAAMLLRVLDIDKGQFVNWPFDWQKASLDIGLDANNADVFAAKLTRVEAAQMALNALQYSPEGEQTNFVVKRNADNEILYSGSNETAAYLVLNDANKNDEKGVAIPTASITSTTTNMGSRGQKMFGLVVTKSTDDLGRTAVNYKAPSYKLNLTVAEKADYTFYGEVANRRVYNTVGKDVATTYTWNVKIDGVAQENGLKPSTANTKYQNTEAGALVEIYVKDDEEVVNVFISYYYIGTVSKVVEAKNGDNRYVMINGKSYETEDFEAKDMVVYTLNGNDIDTVEIAPELTGTLTKIVNDVTFTLDGETYVCAKNHDGVSLVKNDLGRAITFYIDPMGNIMKVKGAAEAGFNADFLWVVANSSAQENPDYITSTLYPYSYKAYGIKADGTVEEWNIVSVDGHKVHPTGKGNNNEDLKYTEDGKEKSYEVVQNNDGNHYGMYHFAKVGNSLRLTKNNTVAEENIEVNKPGVVYGTGEDGYTALANSKTTFVFFEEKSANDHTIVKNSVHVGIANIGTTIAVNTTENKVVVPTGLETGVVVDDKNTVQVVFVKRAWSDGSTAPEAEEAGVAYLLDGRKKIDWLEDDGSKSTRYEYTGIDGTGDWITLIGRDIANYAGCVYSFDADLQIIKPLAAESRQWDELAVEYIRTDAVRLNTVNHSFNITENTTIVDAVDGGFRELNPGDAVVMVTEAASGAKHWNAQVVFVTAPGTEGSESYKPVAAEGKDGKTAETAYEMPQPEAGKAFTIGGISEPKADEAKFKFIQFTGKNYDWVVEVRFDGAANGESLADFTWNNSNVEISDVMAFFYENDTDAAVSNVTLTIKNSNGVLVYKETAASKAADTCELFLVNVVNTRRNGTEVYNDNNQVEVKPSSELSKGVYSWEITVDGAHYAGGRFEIVDTGVNPR